MARSRTSKSRLSNGTAMFIDGVDGRTVIGRRYADIVHDLEAERGGTEQLSVTERELIRTYAGGVVQRDLLHAKLARGEEVDPELLGRLGDRLNRLATRMSKPKTIKPETKGLSLRERHEAAKRERAQ